MKNNKRYVVVSSVEHFVNISGNVYKFDSSCGNTILDEIFDDLDEAIKFVKNYELDISDNRFSIYVESIYVYEYDEENEDIVENSDFLYDKCFSDEKLEKRFDIKIVR